MQQYIAPVVSILYLSSEDIMNASNENIEGEDDMG